MGKMAVPELGK